MEIIHQIRKLTILQVGLIISAILLVLITSISGLIYPSAFAPLITGAVCVALAVVFGPVICVVLLWFIGCLLRDGFREVAKVVVYFLWLWTCRKAGKASNEEDWRYPKKFPGGWEN